MQKTIHFFLIFIAVVFTQTTCGQAFETNLPILKITTKATILDEPKVEGTLEIIDNPNGINKSTDIPTIKHFIGIEYRGSTSQSESPKKPFGIETRNEKGENLNISILGLPAENDWVIISPYSDKSLIRDHLSYTIARQMNRYANRTRFVELFVNGNYNGLCVFGEKIKQGKNRVDIAKLKPTDLSGDDLTGGYIVKIDKTSGSKSLSWNSAYSSPLRPHTFQVESPKIEDIKTEQFNYIKKYINDFENILQSADFKDPEKGYQKVIDTDSFIDYFLVNEITKNVDGYRLSTFFYKDKNSKNSKLTMGPVWDFNLSFGNANYCDGWLNTGWGYRFNDVCPSDPVGGVPFWWNRLLQDANFQTKLKIRYESLRKTTLSDERIMFLLDSSVALLKTAQVRNFEKWPILGRYVWPNKYIANTYLEEINFTKNWLKQRLEWMDNSALLTSKLLPEEALKLDIERPSIYPNPVLHSAKISFGITKNELVKGEIFDISGKKVQIIFDQKLPIGEYIFDFNRANLPSGTYFFRLEKNSKIAFVEKIIVV